MRRSCCPHLEQEADLPGQEVGRRRRADVQTTSEPLLAAPDRDGRFRRSRASRVLGAGNVQTSAATFWVLRSRREGRRPRGHAYLQCEEIGSEACPRLRTQAPSRRGSPSPLSPAELRILQLLPTSTYLQIAATLFISRNTVKTHLRSVYQKLGVTSRAEAIERAIDLRLL